MFQCLSVSIFSADRSGLKLTDLISVLREYGFGYSVYVWAGGNEFSIENQDAVQKVLFLGASTPPVEPPVEEPPPADDLAALTQWVTAMEAARERLSIRLDALEAWQTRVQNWMDGSP